MPVWNTVTNYPVNIDEVNCEYYLGVNNIYCVGGKTGGTTGTNSVYTNHVSASGSLGTWAASNVYPENAVEAGCTLASNVIYCVSGSLSTNAVGPEYGPYNANVYYASILTNNVLTSWQSTTKYPNPSVLTDCVNADGYIYCIGGANSLNSESVNAAQNSIYSANILSTGGLGSWTQLGNYPTNIVYQSCGVANNNIYCIGGTNSFIGDAVSVFLSSVYYAPVLAGGNLGSWTAVNSLPIGALPQPNGCQIANSIIICGPSEVTGSIWSSNTVYTQILPSNSVLAWQNSVNYVTGQGATTCIIDNSTSPKMYCIGGFNGATRFSSAYFASIYSKGIYNSSVYTFIARSPTSNNAFQYNAVVTDSSASPVTANSVTNTIIVNNALVTPTISSSNNLVDYGQYVTLTANAAGGTSPYNYNFIVSNAVTGVVLVSSLVSGVGSSSTTNTIQLSSMLAGNTLAVNVVVTDSASTPVTASSVYIYPGFNSPTASVSPTNPSIDNGQSATLTATGTGTGTLSYQWYSGASATCTSDTQIGGATSGTYVASPTSSKYYCVAVTDSASTPLTTYSATTLITVNPVMGTPTLTPLYNTLDTGQLETYTITASGGSIPYTYSLFNVTSGKTIASQTVVVPSNIVNYIPLTVFNNQSVAAPYNSAILIDVNSLNYIQYENNTLQNIEFFYANGTIIPSWLEGNSSDEADSANVYESSNTYYWLKIVPANMLFPAASSNVIYMGFAGNYLTPINTLLNGVTTGESPLLSQIYGAYDNGANVFQYYVPFGGSLAGPPTGWACSNGTTCTFTATNVLVLGSGGYNAIGISMINNPIARIANTIGVTTEAYAQFPVSRTGHLGLSLDTGVGGSNWDTDIEFLAGMSGTKMQGVIGANTVTTTIAVTTGTLAVWGFSVANYMYATFQQGGFWVNYTFMGSNNGYRALGDKFLTFANSNQVNPLAIYWLDSRMTPPNNVSEAVYFGPVLNTNALAFSFFTNNQGLDNSFAFNALVTDNSLTPVTVNSVQNSIIINNAINPVLIMSNSIVDLGQFEGATLSVGGTSPYTYNFLLKGFNPANALYNGVNSRSQQYLFGAPLQVVYPTTVIIYGNVIDSSGVPVYSIVVGNTFTVYRTPQASVSSNVIIDLGKSATLTATAAQGVSPYTYQWYSGGSPNCISDANIIGGATSTTYLASPTSNTFYCVYVTDSASTPYTTNSQTTLVTVYVPPNTPTIVPSNIVLDNGQFEKFTISVSGGAAPYNAQLFNVSASKLYPGFIYQGWAQARNYPINISTPQCNFYSPNNNIYCISGLTDGPAFTGSQGTAVNSGYYANINPSGNIGTWTALPSYPINVIGDSCTFYTNTLYCVGGDTQNSGSGIVTANAYYAMVIPSNGELTAWQQTTSYPIVDSLLSCNNEYGYIYCVGGSLNGAFTSSNTVFSGNLVTGGGIGAWTQLSNYPVNVAQQSCQLANNNLYCMGGQTNVAFGQNVVFYTPVISGGTIGSWTTLNSIPSQYGDNAAYCQIISNGIYCAAGTAYKSNTVFFSTNSYYTQILPSNSILAWKPTTSYPFAEDAHGCWTINTTLEPAMYCVGGYPNDLYGVRVPYILYGSVTNSSGIANTLNYSFVQNTLQSQFFVNTMTSNTQVTYNGVITDLTFAQVNSISNTIIINPTLALPTISSSGGPVNYGQNIIFTGNVIGGSPPYTYNFVIYNSIANTLITSNSYTGVVNSNQVLQWPVPALISNEMIYANVVVTDGATTAVTLNSVPAGPILINGAGFTTTFSTTSTSITTTISPSSGGIHGSGGSGVYGTTIRSTTTLPAGATTIPTSSTLTTTVTTTTVLPITIIPIKLNSTQMVIISVNASSTSPAIINFSSSNTELSVYSNSSAKTGVNVTLSNVSRSLLLPAGASTVSAINISSQQTLSRIDMTMHYPCNVSSSNIAPYQFKNNTWYKLQQYSVNATSCTVTFSTSGNGIIALIIGNISGTNPMNTYVFYAAAAIVAIIALFLVHHFFKFMIVPRSKK